MARQVRVLRAARVFQVFFIVFTLSFSANGAENSSTSSNCTGQGAPLAGHLFSLLPAYPSFTDTANERCRNDSIILRQQLEQFKLWAVKMLDASSKLPSGVLAGNVYQLGHFDECLSVQVGLQEGRELKGQYCLTRVEYSPKNLTVEARPKHTLSELFNTSAWSFVKAFNLDRSRNRRDEIYWALCVPDSCKNQEVVEAMTTVLRSHQDPAGVDISVTIAPNMCQVASSEGYFSWIGIGQLLVGAVVAFFLLSVVLSTFLQGIKKITPKENAGFGKFLNCFSMQNNFRALWRVDSSRDIMVVHTCRFLSMLVILLGHRFINDAPAPRFNADFSEDNLHNPLLIHTIISPVLVVDTFFLLSGFLTGNQIFNDLEAGRFKLFSFYLHRYIRLTPVYMLVVAFYALFLVHIGSGPLYLSRISIEQQRCVDNWWANLLYINNYVNPDQMCMFQTWHLSCDFHFLLMAPPLVYFLWKRPKTAIAFMLLMIGVCSAFLFSFTFIYSLDANLLAYKSVLADLSADPTFVTTYIPTHMRYAPYFFGLLASYTYFKRKSIGTVTPLMAYAAAGAVAVLLHIPILASLSFYLEGIEYNVWTASLYASLHRIPWSIGLCLLIVLAATNNLYFFQSIVSWKVFAPLSRLTYCVFLIHAAIQLYAAATVRVGPYNDHFLFVWTLFGDVAFIYVGALIVHLIFEAPILRLDRTYWTASSRKVVTGEENRGFTIEAPAVFSNQEGPFTITEGKHEKYSDRHARYAKPDDPSERR